MSPAKRTRTSRAGAKPREIAARPTDRRRMLAFPFVGATSISVDMIIGAVAVVLVLGAFGGTYFKGRADGDGAGFDRAKATYEKLMADQAAANSTAVDAANKHLMETADELSKTEKERDDALAQIDATAGGPDGAQLGLDARRMHDLGTIK